MPVGNQSCSACQLVITAAHLTPASTPIWGLEQVPGQGLQSSSCHSLSPCGSSWYVGGAYKLLWDGIQLSKWQWDDAAGSPGNLCCAQPPALCLVPTTAVTNCHRLSGFKQHEFILFQFWRSETSSFAELNQDIGRTASS